jgi:hypothetical protein
MELSDWSEYFLRKKIKMLREKYDMIENKLLAFEKRIYELESSNEMITEQIKFYTLPSYKDETWIKIKGHVIETKNFQLLNPSKKYSFRIVEVSNDFIRVDKLGKVKLSKEMFISVYDYLRSSKDWIRIGASVRNTKPDTIEGFLKSKFYGGNMNAQMTAPWISAILVGAGVDVKFNNKRIGQAIKHVREP